MSQDKELEIQMQFLEEATDYLNTLEGILLEFKANRRIELQKINAALRAVHSIKGGAGIMGFRTMSDLAHRLEDYLKVLKTPKNSLQFDTELHSLLLSAVDWLRQIVELLSVGHVVDEQWLETFCYPVFEELSERLGSPNPEDATSMLSPEDSPQDIIPLLFQTEVEGYLQRLESLLAEGESPGLREEVMMMAAELGGLGEMLQIPSFSQLCESVTEYLEANFADEAVIKIAHLALQTWRRSQALILTNEFHNLPTEIHAVSYSEPEDFGSAKESHPPDIILSSRQSKNPEKTVRVPVKQIEKINNLFGELTIQRNSINLQLDRLQKLIRNLSSRVKTIERENYELRIAYDKFATQLAVVNSTQQNATNDWKFYKPDQIKGISHAFDNLELDRYHDLHMLSQTVMETIVKIQEITTDIELSLEDTDQVNRLLNKTAQNLQKSLTQVRMRPLSDIVDRFKRALHDLSVEYGKNVQLNIEGGNTLIERSILEALNEPLMHLLRNAFAHGIEDPDTRHLCGKPEQGLIEIKAIHQGDRIIITMSDDGGGISLEKIRDRAFAMGLDPILLAQATDEELLSLIFEPGFSTSEQVTALSGRGVGMDIVRSNLKQVRGDVKVHTVAGEGTTFTLSVPFTLSVARVLLVESNKMLLAFPTDVVSEIFLLRKEQVFSIAEGEVLNWQGTMLPLIRLDNYLEFNCPRYDNPNLETPQAINATSVLIVQDGNHPVALQVDCCWGEQEVAIRKIEGNISLPPGFSNCTILGNGRVVPLVSANDLLYWMTNRQIPATELTIPTFALDIKNIPNQKGTILVVDDSINVRRYLALTLEKAGYRVQQAKDGQDALEKLIRGLQVQAVICDIEMPRLDGYSLLIRLKTLDNLKDIPVAILSSRSSNKHRQMAMQLGARAYFYKPYNEQELLQNLEQIIFPPLEVTVAQD
ncbi:MAG: response regulator [Heteroscytonema crispum UTEX LB 1556]